MCQTFEGFFRQSCRDDWLHAGVTYALEQGAGLLPHMGGPRGRRLRRLAAANVVTLAFARHFAAVGTHVQLLGAASRAPVVTQIRWGHRQGWLAPTWVFQPEICKALQHGDFRAEQGLATLPWTLRETAAARGDDLMFFGLLLATEAPAQSQTAPVLAERKPIAPVHWLPARWQRSAAPQMMLTLKAENALSITLYGTSVHGNALRHTVVLRAGEAHRLTLPWQGVHALETRVWPRGRVGLQADGRGVHVISPEAWENVYLYGKAVWLLGFTTWRQFWRQARYLRRGARSFPHGTHFSPAYGVPWCALEPLGAL